METFNKKSWNNLCDFANYSGIVSILAVLLIVFVNNPGLNAICGLWCIFHLALRFVCGQGNPFVIKKIENDEVSNRTSDA